MDRFVLRDSFEADRVLFPVPAFPRRLPPSGVLLLWLELIMSPFLGFWPRVDLT